MNNNCTDQGGRSMGSHGQNRAEYVEELKIFSW